MDVEYLDPCRYDYDTSDDESSDAATPPAFVVRLKPPLSVARTLLISLVPFAGEQIGLVYSPAQPPKHQPLSTSTQSTSALSRIFWANSMHVVVATSLSAELQFGWVRELCAKLSPSRIVVVDAHSGGPNEFRSPAVLASALVVGLPAAVMNYAEAFGVPCRHVRVDGQKALSVEDVDALFASKQQVHAADSFMLDHSVPTSLYV